MPKITSYTFMRRYMPSHSPSHALHHLEIGNLSSITNSFVPERRGIKRIAQGLLLLVSMTCAFTAHADTVTLANGDRLTGMIVKSDGKQLTLKTDYAGCSDEPAK